MASTSDPAHGRVQHRLCSSVRLRQGHRARPARPSGAGDRLRRHDRPLDRPSPALRGAAQQRADQSTAHEAAIQPTAGRRGSQRFQAEVERIDRLRGGPAAQHTARQPRPIARGLARAPRAKGRAPDPPRTAPSVFWRASCSGSQPIGRAAAPGGHAEAAIGRAKRAARAGYRVTRIVPDTELERDDVTGPNQRPHGQENTARRPACPGGPAPFRVLRPSKRSIPRARRDFCSGSQPVPDERMFLLGHAHAAIG